MSRLLQASLSTQIIVSLLLGVASGVFFGEWCGPLAVIGDVFIGLLQMTVLPYIAVALVASFGRLTWQESRRLAGVGGLVLLILWIVALLTVTMMTLAFPQWQSGSFFSSALLEQPPAPDLVSLFVPTNIFAALSENQIPAVVLFCVCAGVALAQVKKSKRLLKQLDTVASVLMQISKFITRLAPLGIFAIAASTAGTASFAELNRLQAYWIAYSGGAAFLGLVVLPLLITTLTPLNYWQVFRVVKEPALTAFATGKLIIVLPMLVENTERVVKELSASQGAGEHPPIDVLYSTSYPFPNAGKLLTMLFIPFSAWFLGNPIRYTEYPAFLSAGLFAYFGGPLLAIPALLDQMKLPHDMFQLFVVSGIFDGRISDALGAMHLATFTLISMFGFRGSIRIRALSLVRYVAIVILVGSAVLLSVRATLGYTIAAVESKHNAIVRMQLLERPVASTVTWNSKKNPDSLQSGENLLQRIRRRGRLRIGFNEDKVPFAFYNQNQDLVGYDVNMAHALARDLDVELEFVRFDRETLAERLRQDHFDLVMSGLVGTLERSEAMQHTKSYLDVNLALVVPDFRVSQFQSIEAMRNLNDLRIGFVDLSRGFTRRLREALPSAQLIEIKFNRDFFVSDSEELDGLLISAESGSFFTLMYPGYEVVVPSDLAVKLPLIYAIAHQDAEMRDFLEHWVTLRQKDGTAAEFYEHWILGKVKQKVSPRWCIIRDYLHWVD